MSHTHSLYDSDMRFLIDSRSGKIKNQSNRKSLIRHAHKSERFTFEIQRNIEGHDMSKCNMVEIHYKNMDDEDIYTVNDLAVSSEDENVVIFSWLITRNATSNAGTLKFAIHFLCDDYDFPTESCSVKITDTINNTDTIEEKYLDIFARHDVQIEERERTMKESIESVTGKSYDGITAAIQDMQSVFDDIGNAEAMIDESGVIAYDISFR